MATIKSFEVDRWSERDEKGRAGEYCLYTCDVGSCYHPVHEQEGRRLFGTKEEIIHEIETSAEK